jgi:hypothetical protein
MVALVDTGDDTALRVSHEIDPELIYLWLAERIDVVMTTKDGEEEVPDAAQTLDGQFYYAARHDKDDLAEITTFLRLLFQKDYWRYFRMLQAVSWELPTEMSTRGKRFPRNTRSALGRFRCGCRGYRNCRTKRRACCAHCSSSTRRDGAQRSTD